MTAMRQQAPGFAHRDLISVEDLSADDITLILDLADRYAEQNRARERAFPRVMEGMVLVNLFLEHSTRTRISFEIAAKKLGAHVVNMDAEGSSIKKGESITDTLKTLGAMLPDALVIRHAAEGAAAEAAEICACPVLNAGDGARAHPTQALLDALALRRHFGRLEGLKVAIVGDVLHSRVAQSDIALLKKMGAEVACVGPRALLPEGPGTTTDMKEGLEGAHAVMALRLQKERQQLKVPLDEREYFAAYGITQKTLAYAREGAVVMHPGPMNRGVEIDGALADGPRSLITAQVELGVAVRMACLDLLVREKL